MKKQLVIAGIVLTFTASQCYTGYTLAKEIDDQKEMIHKLESVGFEQRQLIEKQQQEIDNLEEIIVHKEGRIQELVTQVEQVTKEKEEVKKQLVSRGEQANQVTLNMQITAYTSDCNGCSGITYSGHDVRNTITINGLRVIAANFNKLPLYSIVRIDTPSESFKAIVLDTGGAIRNSNVVDLLVGSYGEAIQFGRQSAKITILRKGE